MAKIETFTPGTFCWVDLATTDTRAAESFYTKLFGWTAQAVPVDETVVYTMLLKEGVSAAGMTAMEPQAVAQGIPPHWNTYIATDDADAIVEEAQALGATILLEPFDVMDAGRMAVIRDPEGAVFCLWQAAEDGGATLKDEPGSFCWNELYVHDTERAVTFYEALFGWTHTTNPGALGQPYVQFKQGDEMVAGMMQIRPEWGENVPPAWGIYFAVENCDVTLAKATTLGGRSMMEPMEIEQVGRFGTIADPQGAVFMIIQLAPR